MRTPFVSLCNYICISFSIQLYSFLVFLWKHIRFKDSFILFCMCNMINGEMFLIRV